MALNERKRGGVQAGQTAQILVIDAFLSSDFCQQIDDGIGNFVGFASFHRAKMRAENEAKPPD